MIFGCGKGNGDILNAKVCLEGAAFLRYIERMCYNKPCNMQEETPYHSELAPHTTSLLTEEHPSERTDPVVEPTTADKQAAWEAKREEIDDIADALDLGIDAGIKETVVAFNMLGFNTSGSCEGHLDHGLSTPYIDIEAPDRPETKYVGEMEIFQRVADQYHVPLEEVRRAIPFEAWKEAYRESSRNEYTPEFQRFMEETNQAKRRLEPFIEKFYAGKDVPSDIRLHIDTSIGSLVRVWCGESETHFAHSEDALPQQVRSMLLAKRQEEMRAFTNFLREKYFSESNISDANTPKPLAR